MQKPVRILGIDPGYDRLGIAILESHNGKELLVYATCFETNKRDSFERRLVASAQELERVVALYSPDELAIEDLFITNNQKTAIKVAELRGVCLYIAAKHNLRVGEYSPPQIKMGITGYGRASKDDIAYMVKRIITLPHKEKQLDDEVDAIAVALVHSASRKTLFLQAK